MSKRKTDFPYQANKKRHWSHGLLSSMEDPELRIFSDDLVIVIKDKYPKAQYHYLVLPKENINSIKNLEKKHLKLLQHMEKIAKQIIQEKHKEVNFNIGYHSNPSMTRLHLHVISDDMNSVCLKNKKHWNSFTTDFFIDSKDIIKDVKENGKVDFTKLEKCKKLIDSPLKCNKCDFIPKNIPDLKKHILIHLKKI